MPSHDGRRLSGFCFFISLAALSGISCTVLLKSQSTHPDSPVATYSQGILRVGIPYRASHSGDGQLTVEVLNPENDVLGTSQQAATAGNGTGWWDAQVSLTPPIPVDNLVWQRLHYRFTFSDGKTEPIEATDSISQILRRPVLHIVGQQSYIAGAPAAVRVVVMDSRNQPVAGRGSVRIDLAIPNQKAHTLFTGRLNDRGTTDAQFRFPARVAGNFPLHYVVDTPIGSTEFTQQVRIEDKISTLLTTEKPIYQPGQTIHARALTLDRSNHEAASNRELTFEVEDSRGNKVFKKATQTDRFGVASAEFALADEVNLGTYHVRTLMDGAAAAGPSKTAEIAINVERYVLPKFKVAVHFADNDNKTKRGYRPGDHVTGIVRANYFFGKPVDRADVTVKGTGIDVAQFEIGSVQGKTDGGGSYHFDIQLPRYFAGRPLGHSAARVLIEATVKDGAGHRETRGEPVTVSENPFIITAVPEGGTLIPNLENQVFILTSYPDGTPAPADLRISAAGNPDQNVATDQGGVAVVRIKPAPQLQKINIEAKDKEGNRSSTSVSLDIRAGSDQVLLRVDRGVYRAGDRIALHVFSTVERGTAYLDVIKEGQTVLTRDVQIEHGRAELTIAATPDLAGTLDFNAYLFGTDARPVADHRLVFVQPADELKIESTGNAPLYKPGEEARVHFRVTNSHGEGVQAALGLQVVDEAVFALAEKQPGFAKVFFYLEQEVMKPRYEIHSIGMPEIVEPVPVTKLDQRDRAARALFAATEMVSNNKFETEVGRAVSQVHYGEYYGRYHAHFVSQAARLADALTRLYRQNSSHASLSKADLTKAMLQLARERPAETRDAWDTPLRLERTSWDRSYYALQSAGPDKEFGTPDDLWAQLQVRTGKVVRYPISGSIDLKIEHDRGSFNGRAEIAGSVTDPMGAGIANATVTVREVSTGAARRASTNASGQFSLPGLDPGDCEVSVSAAGFQIESRKLSLRVRDRAVLSATLMVGETNETVVVDSVARPLRAADARFLGGIAGGVPGGAIGGVVGGLPSAVPAPAVPAPRAFQMAAKDLKSANTATVMKQEAASPAPHVRSYFPEALYINPEIITDQNGKASVTIPVADSITTWRMAMIASTIHGALGSGTSSLKVFQDFFVDLDLPVTLTQGDRVSIPVAAYNYSGSRGDVTLKLQADDWFTLANDTSEKTISVEAGGVGGAQFTIEARRIGKFKLTLAANMKGIAGRADVVVREIEVIPDGREQNQLFNGRLESVVNHEVSFPATSVPDASSIFVRLYPGPLSQIIEGMDAILRMPYGCFEQTSSSTYPNVLALDYMKRTKKLTPEVHAKAEGFIANGYQRLLTFEVPGGGFSWFGQAPANKILTSYGLMEFSDMSKVHDIDPKLIQRTQQWLAGQQQEDGSWKPDTNFINEGATNRYNSDLLRITGYIGWALVNTGYQGPAIEKAHEYLARHMRDNADAYTLAVLANFAVEYRKDPDFTRQVIQRLLDARTGQDDKVWWTSEETSLYARGVSASVETTGLAVQALLKSGEASAVASQALTYLASKKDASGTWGTTQATIMALRAILLSTEKGAADVRGTVEITLNGKPVRKLILTPDNNDLLHQFVFKNVDIKSPNTVALRFDGKGGLAYQVVGRYFLPWQQKPVDEPLSINVAYDRTRLSQDDIATATATVKNNLSKSANMVMLDLGIPPGFDLLSEDLQSFQEKTAGQKGGRLEKFNLTATQAILYFDSIPPASTVTLRYRLRAKYPIRARTLQARVYEYYQPEVNSIARPVQIEVARR